MEHNPLLKGDKFGLLTVVERVANRGKKLRYKFLCECGRLKEIDKYSVQSGNTKSCGCLYSKNCPARTHGKSKTKTYAIWRGILARCYNTKLKAYPYYGGRGITVCEEWFDYINFLKDMGERPEGMSLDRTDTNAGYSKQNCRWATAEEQAQNKRKLSTNTTGRTGISIRTATGQYLVEIKTDGVHEYGGIFSNLEDAIAKREELEIKHRGFVRKDSYDNPQGGNSESN